MSELESDVIENPATILCVDDEPNILSSLRRLLRKDGHKILVAGSGAEGLQLLETEPVDLVISDMRMPEMDGAQFLEQVFARWPNTKRILLTGYADAAATIAAINRGKIFRYVSKPWNDGELIITVQQSLAHRHLLQENARMSELIRQHNEELKAMNASLEQRVAERTAELRIAHEKLKSSFIMSIKVFSNLTELSEGQSAGHSRRVADLARRIAVKLGLERNVVQDVMVAGLLHDIGKIGLPDILRNKPANQLTPEEQNLLRKHPAKGEAALMALDDLRTAARMLRSHHERYDGRGYPDGLQTSDIPMGARILAVANDFDALRIGTFVSKRLSEEEASLFIKQSSGNRYDPDVVKAFLEVRISEAAEQGPKSNEITITPMELKPGMILSRDLIAPDGTLLLSSGHQLDAGLIKSINDFAKNEEERVVIYVRGD